MENKAPPVFQINIPCCCSRCMLRTVRPFRMPQKEGNYEAAKSREITLLPTCVYLDKDEKTILFFHFSAKAGYKCADTTAAAENFTKVLRLIGLLPEFIKTP